MASGFLTGPRESRSAPAGQNMPVLKQFWSDFCATYRAQVQAVLLIWGFFEENCNAQGHAVFDFSDLADRVYCSQTLVFAKTALRAIELPETYTLR